MPRSSSKKTAGALNQSKSKRRCRTQHHKQRHSCERDNCTARKFGSKHRNRRGSKKQEEMAAHGKYTALLQRSASMNRNKRAMQMQLQFPQREQMHELHDVPARHDCRMQVPLADHGSAAAARSSTTGHCCAAAARVVSQQSFYRTTRCEHTEDRGPPPLVSVGRRPPSPVKKLLGDGQLRKGGKRR